MKKNYNRRYLKKDNTISVYNFNQEIKHIDPEIKKLKQDIRPFINKMSKDNLNKLLDFVKNIENGFTGDARELVKIS